MAVDRSRSQSVVRGILGDRFRGHLVSDFDAGYNDYGCQKQRCWVHLIRLIHKRQERYLDNQELLAWIQAVRGLYDEAKECLAKQRSLWPNSELLRPIVI